MERLYFYKLVSPYKEDITKDCKLTVNEIDYNFLTLKDADIKDLKFDRESKTLILTTNANETFVADLSDVTYDLNVKYDKGIGTQDGATLTIKYDGKFGPEEIVVDNVVTTDNLRSVIGSDILTKVITDGTLTGNGTVHAPLGLKTVERTGFYRPAISVIDKTKGENLPGVDKLGTRYITKEFVSDFGRLYNFEAVKQIQERLQKENKGWRIPTKEDWDRLLNSIEDCNDKNHNSAQCHVELGKYAGTFLKTECGWNGQPDCTCISTIPAYDGSTSCKTDEDTDFIDDSGEPDMPAQKPLNYKGVDKYGFSILPTGKAIINSHNVISAVNFKDSAYFWTTTHIHDDEQQDVYVKHFVWNKAGVEQIGFCTSDYHSIRLVKDYDGSNHLVSEYIDGENYDTLLFPESKQIWIDRNFVNERFDGVTEVNDGVDVNHRRVQFFINDWNGEYWDKKPLVEGDTIVLTERADNGQFNIEYRVYLEDNCNQALVDTDDVTTERVLDVVIPLIDKEREERISGDTALNERVDKEIADRIEADEIERNERISGDTILNEKLDQEIADRISGNTSLNEKLDQEIADRISGDTHLQEEIDFLRKQAEDADRTIMEVLANEIDERRENDRILSGAIETEREERISGDTLLNERLDQEISDRIEADAAERNERMEVDYMLEQMIDQEVARATARENEIDDQLIDNTRDYVIEAVPELDENGKVSPNLTLISKNPGANNVEIRVNWNFGEF